MDWCNFTAFRKFRILCLATKDGDDLEE